MVLTYETDVFKRLLGFVILCMQELVPDDYVMSLHFYLVEYMDIV